MIKTDAIAGCASIMKTERLKKIGLSDPDFFYGEEDIELSYQLAEVKNLFGLIWMKGISPRIRYSWKKLG